MINGLVVFSVANRISIEVQNKPKLWLLLLAFANSFCLESGLRVDLLPD